MFFSNDTHTIYVPTLEAKWDDSSFATGSLTELTADDITLYMKNLKRISHVLLLIAMSS